MYQGAGRAHISAPEDITTINYSLEWPYLENPSNTTFVGPTQIDICRCPKGNDSYQKSSDSEPGHIYTRYECTEPRVRFHSPEEGLWVLESVHGPINMLRPASHEEKERRKEVHSEADAAVYANRKLLFLSGPCPRGRYQSYATMQFLRSLSPSARAHISCLSLLVQPYEEDCSEDYSKRAYAELAEYVLQNLPAFSTLYLNIWDDETKLRAAASEFSILLHKSDVKIAVGMNWWKGEMKEFNTARAFLEIIASTRVARHGRRIHHGELEEGLIWQKSKKVNVEGEEQDDTDKEEDHSTQIHDDEQGGESEGSAGGVSIALEEVVASPKEENGEDEGETSGPSIAREAYTTSEAGDSRTQREGVSEQNEGKVSSETTHYFPREEHSSDDEWTDAALSPISPLGTEEDTWQVL